LQKPFRGLFQGFLGNESYDLAGEGNHAVALGFALDEFEDAVDRSLFEVGEVHGNLRLSSDQEAGALNETQTAVGEADGLGNLLGNVDVGRVEKNVVGDERFAGADDGGSGGGMEAAFSVIGFARGVGGDIGANAFKLAAANVLKVLALGRRGSGFVKVDRNVEALVDFGGNVARHGNTVFEGDAVDGDKRDDVGGSHARMRALMLGEVDEFGGLANSADGSFLDGFAIADQGDDAAVVIGIHLAVEEIDSGNFHGFEDGINFGGVAAFRKIGDAFDKSAGHGRKDNGGRRGEATRASILRVAKHRLAAVDGGRRRLTAAGC